MFYMVRNTIYSFFFFLFWINFVSLDQNAKSVFEEFEMKTNINNEKNENNLDVDFEKKYEVIVENLQAFEKRINLLLMD